jgi:hypothetical protein
MSPARETYFPGFPFERATGGTLVREGWVETALKFNTRYLIKATVSPFDGVTGPVENFTNLQ